MPKFVSTLTWSAASGAYVWSGSLGGERLFLVPDSPAWFARLAELPSFAFHGKEGSYTARQERRARDERYWYAYLRTGQQVRKKYLGKTAELTISRLEQVARILLTERLPGGLPAPTLPPTQETRQPKASLPADPFNPLLSTRLHLPRPPVRLVPRPRLIERLSQGLWQPLILVCAPAGFGKTTLLAEWLAEHRLPVAWLSLDAEDNDPLRFLSAVLSALATCDPALGASARAFLSSPHGLSLHAVFALLINEIATSDLGTLVLVLDDFHLISDPEIHRALGYLVEHCPPNLHLVIASRTDPSLALARLRARGHLCELRAADLQFDAQEARAFLHATLGRDLEISTLATILTRTEGWAAGLQLTALSLQAHRSEAEVAQFLAEALGSQRYLVDYLVEEVLVQQPEAVQAFLLRTSILEPLSAGLAAAVTEAESEAESEALLRFVEQANLFLFPLDERGEWYRYHPLWAAVLRVRLERRLGEASVSALYGRASRWYERHRLEASAIDAALAAGEIERATQLLEQWSPVLMVRGQYLAVRRWIERLPPEQWRTRPLLCVRYAWALFHTGQRSASEAPLEDAEHLLAREANPAAMGLVAALRAVAAIWLGEGEVGLAAARQALALLPAAELNERATCTSAMGGGYWLLGEVEQAVQKFGEARALYEQTGNRFMLLSDRLVLGHVFVLQGKLHAAAAAYQQVMQEAGLWRDYAIEAMIHLAGVLYEWNALEEAEAHLDRALAEINEAEALAVRSQGVLVIASITQARLREARGEHEEARARLRQAVLLAEQGRHSRSLARALAWQVRWWLAQGEREAVRRWYEARTARQEPEPTYQGERDALTLARVLIFLGEATQALRLLDGYRTLAQAQGRLGSELRILLLCARAEAHRGRTEPAVQHLHQACSLAEPEGYVRLFLDEGPELVPLLRLVLGRRLGQRLARYVQQVLTRLSAEHPEPADFLPRDLLPPGLRLSARELEVLRLLAEGLSTPQMATRLVVSPNTVKTQLASLYRKLDVRSREEALVQAVRFRLL